MPCVLRTWLQISSAYHASCASPNTKETNPSFSTFSLLASRVTSRYEGRAEAVSIAARVTSATVHHAKLQIYQYKTIHQVASPHCFHPGTSHPKIDKITNQPTSQPAHPPYQGTPLKVGTCPVCPILTHHPCCSEHQHHPFRPTLRLHMMTSTPSKVHQYLLVLEHPCTLAWPIHPPMHIQTLL